MTVDSSALVGMPATAIPTSAGPVAWDSVMPNRALRLIGELGAEPSPIAETEVDGD